MPVPPLLDGPDLTSPDAASRFRQQLLADVDELLKQHHERLARHVDENLEELSAQFSKTPLKTTQFKTTRNSPAILKDVDHLGRVRATITTDRPKPLRPSRRSKRSDRSTATPDARSAPEGEKVFLESSTAHVQFPRDLQLSEGHSQHHQMSVQDASFCQASQQTSAWVIRSFSDEWAEKLNTAKSVQNVPSLSAAQSNGGGSVELGSVMKRRPAMRIQSTQSILKGVVNSAVFETALCILIASNALFFGVETQFLASSCGDQVVFDAITLLYTVIFTVELIVRFLADPRGFYSCTPRPRLWNFLDTFVVAMSLCELGLKVGGAATFSNLTYIRIIRIARTVRIFRVVRVLQVFSSLRILLYCVLNTLRSLIWTMVLLFIILYIFGILFTQAATEVLKLDRGTYTDPNDLASWDALKRHYGSLETSIYSEFKAVTGGVSWQEVSEPLSLVHPIWEILFCVFISITYFSVLNVVTGVFCQSAIESAANDKDMVVQAQLANKKLYTEQLRDLFTCIDAESSGKVTYEMLESCLDDPQCQAYFEVLGITSDDAWNLFMLLDDDDSSQIELEEFVSGCLRLRGSARSIDSHMLLYESRWVMKRISHLERAVTGLLEHLGWAEHHEDGEGGAVGERALTYKEFRWRKEERSSATPSMLAMVEASSGSSTTGSPGSHPGHQRHDEQAGLERQAAPGGLCEASRPTSEVI